MLSLTFRFLRVKISIIYEIPASDYFFPKRMADPDFFILRLLRYLVVLDELLPVIGLQGKESDFW